MNRSIGGARPRTGAGGGRPEQGALAEALVATAIPSAAGPDHTERVIHQR